MMPDARGRRIPQMCDFLQVAAVAKRQSRNASRAATLGNSKIGAEIRSTRLLVRDIVELTITNEIHPLVRKRLAEVVQLVQSYCRLAELEIAAGDRPKAGEVALPEDIPERVREWAHGEEANVREREELVGELIPKMKKKGYDTVDVKAVIES